MPAKNAQFPVPEVEKSDGKYEAEEEDEDDPECLAACLQPLRAS